MYSASMSNDFRGDMIMTKTINGRNKIINYHYCMFSKTYFEFPLVFRVWWTSLKLFPTVTVKYFLTSEVSKHRQILHYHQSSFTRQYCLGNLSSNSEFIGALF